MTVFPHDEVPSVAVVGFGDPAPDVPRQVAEIYESEFGVPVSDAGTVPFPDTISDDPEAIDAGALVDAADPADDAYDFVLGVTDRELRQGTRYGIFGLWFQGGRAGVLSTAGLFGEEPDDPKARSRLRKIVLKGAGSLFGFGYHGNCVMAESPTVGYLDAKPGEFCDDCTRRLRGDDTAPEPPEWHVLTEELEEFKTAQRWAAGDVRLAEYPLIAVGYISLGLERARRGLSSITLPREVRALVHETYRIGHFWWKVGTFLLAYLVVAAGLAQFVDLQNGSTTVVWLVLAGSLPLAYLVSGFANSVLAGLVAGLRLVVGEELGAEE